MKSTKLVKILRTFSKEEMKLFEKFVASPYHNGKICLPLLKEIKKFYPEFKSRRLSYEYLYGKLHPHKIFKKQVMWNLTSAMEKVAEEFLEQVAFKKNKFHRMGLLLSELGNRKLLNNYSSTLNKMQKQLENNAMDYYYFENMGHLEDYKQEYYHLKDSIQPMSDSKLKAVEYQILLFLRMTVGGLNDMNLLSKNYNSKFDINIPLEFAKHLDLKSIRDYARNKNFKYAFLIDIYYYSLMMLLQPKEAEYLYKVRELYEMHYNKFTLSEKRNMMHWILNYCIRRSESEGIKYERIIFELNKFRLKEGLAFYPEKQIPKAIYYQILKAALCIDETKWAENFIKNYTSMLQPEIQESIGAIAYAFLHFQRKEYEKVLKNLINAEFIDIRDKLFARSLISRTYYEMNEFDTLLNNIDSSKHFLRKNKSVSEYYETSYHNFFNFLIRVISIKENADLSSVPILKKEILSTTKLENKKWLLEKLEELIIQL